MQIFVQGQQVHTINVTEVTTVEELKEILLQVNHTITLYYNVTLV